MALLLEYPVVDIISNYINSDSVYGNIINENDFKSLIVSLGDEVGQYTGPGHYVVLPLNKEPLTGIDIPVLVKRDKQSERPVIAIVAQDPLRSEKDKNLKVFKAAGSAIIGTPFALHYKEDDYPQTIVYRRIIECLLSYRDGYDVYITDAHKTYPRKKGLKRKEEDVLKAEIKKIEPRLVITFGSEAKEYFDKIKEDFEK